MALAFLRPTRAMLRTIPATGNQLEQGTSKEPPASFVPGSHLDIFSINLDDTRVLQDPDSSLQRLEQRPQDVPCQAQPALHQPQLRPGRAPPATQKDLSCLVLFHLHTILPALISRRDEIKIWRVIIHLRVHVLVNMIHLFQNSLIKSSF